MPHVPQLRWHLDEVLAEIRGERHYLWRAVGHESEVLEAFVTKRREKASALKFLKKAMKRYGNADVVVTYKFPSQRAAMKVTGNERRQEISRHLNSRAENSHLPFRRREKAMLHFRRKRNLQKFASANSSVHNQCSHQRNTEGRARFKSLRDAALREWRDLLVARRPLAREFRRRVRIRLTAPCSSRIRRATCRNMAASAL